MKTSLLHIAFLLLLAAMASAQRSGEKARIEGTVMSSTGTPVPRAQVRLTRQASLNDPAVSLSGRADDKGRFTIENIPAGSNYQLTAERPGFLNARFGSRTPKSPGSPLTINAGADFRSVVIRMTPQGILTGRLTDENGDPVQGATVRALRRGYQGGQRQLINAGVQTDPVTERGEFRIANLPPGRYYIAAGDPDALHVPSSTSRGHITNVTTYYPNSVEPGSAVAVEVTPGAELKNIDIRLRRETRFALRGKVDTGGIVPAGPVSVIVLRKGTGWADPVAQLSQKPAERLRSPQYAFELRGLAPGTYLLHTWTTYEEVNGPARVHLGAWTEATIIDEDVKDVVVPLAYGAPIKGTMTVEGGDLKALLKAGKNFQNSLTPSLGTPLRLVSTSIKDDGTFQFEGIAPGRYLVDPNLLTQDFYVKSAHYDGREVLRNGLDIGPGGGGDLAIILSNKPGQIAGSMVAENEKSMAGFMVILWTKNPEPGSVSNGVRTTFTDQSGNFLFRNLPPGEYLAAAFEDADPQLVQSRDFLGQFSSEASSVTIQEGGNGTAQAKLISSEKAQAAEAKLP